MKQEIENHEALLKKLVLEGDAHAFFSLTKSYLQERYLRERSSGTSPEDSGRKVIAEAVELLEQVQHISAKHFDAWLEEHCSLTEISATSGNSELLIDTKIIAETDHFLNGCSRELLRTGSDLKRAAEMVQNKFPRVFLRNKAFIVALFITLALLVGAGFTLLLIKLNLAVEVHFISEGGNGAFRYPPAAWADVDAPANVLPVSASEAEDTTGKSGIIQDTVNSDTLAKKAAAVTPSTTSPSGAVTDTRSRALPPVVPKARMILPPAPPPPPPPPEPVQQEEPVFEEEPSEPVQQPVTPPPSPSVTTEPESPF